jgi:hypothetical protein
MLPLPLLRPRLTRLAPSEKIRHNTLVHDLYGCFPSTAHKSYNEHPQICRLTCPLVISHLCIKYPRSFLPAVCFCASLLPSPVLNPRTATR